MNMDRKAGRGDQGGVTGSEQSQAHVAEALLRADRRHNFLVRVEADPESGFVTIGNLFT